jgi:hypothetical protein
MTKSSTLLKELLPQLPLPTTTVSGKPITSIPDSYALLLRLLKSLEDLRKTVRSATKTEFFKRKMATDIKGNYPLPQLLSTLLQSYVVCAEKTKESFQILQSVLKDSIKLTNLLDSQTEALHLAASTLTNSDKFNRKFPLY